MQFIQLEGNKITRIAASNTIPKEAIAVPNDHELVVGSDIKMYDENYHLKPLEQLIKDKFIEPQEDEEVIDGQIIKKDINRTIYLYNSDDFVYKKSLDNVKKDKEVPFSTEVMPKETKKENEVNVFNEELNDWEIKEDNRDKEYWYKHNSEKVEFSLGDKIDDTMTDIEPHDSDTSWDETNHRWYVPQEVKKQRIRDERNNSLMDTDYLMMPDYPITDTRKQEWKKYRQALRDITKQAGFPDDVKWPTKP